VSLSLRDKGLSCPSVPLQFGLLTALTRLDISGNELSAGVQEVATVRRRVRSSTIKSQLCNLRHPGQKGHILTPIHLA
jgi:hypothetical protein